MVEAALNAEHLGEVSEKGTVELSLGGAPRLAMSWAISMLPMAERVGKRLKRWKIKPILARRVRVRSASVEGGEVDAIDEDGAGGGPGEAAEDVEEGGFAGAGGADDSDELAGSDGEVDLAKGGDFELCRSDRSCRDRGRG